MRPTCPETVLITGASSGIGLELARCFAKDQSRLILVARSTDALEKIAADLRAIHRIEVLVLTADLSKPESPQEIFNQTGRAGVAVDVLVNNAGFGSLGPFADLPLQRQLDMLQVNINALVALTGLFLPAMLERRDGGILNVGSLAGFQPGPGMAVYFATKAFVLSFSEALATETAGSGITVSALCPGSTATNFGKVARGHLERKRQFSKMSAEAVAGYGYKKFRRGKVIAIPGLTNRIVPSALRVLPRNWVRKLAGRFNAQVSLQSSDAKPK